MLAVLAFSFFAIPLVYADEDSWSKTYGGPLGDKAFVVVKTQDGGYALAGTTNSFGEGIVNAWLIKLDDNGEMQWNQTYSGLGQAFVDTMIQTSDGGYALSGYSYSLEGGLYVWLCKTNSTGGLSWNQTYPDVGTSIGYGVIQTTEGGYAIVGASNSVGSGENDGWVIKTNANGLVEWYKTYGGPGNDALYSIVQTSDGGYALGGETESYSSTGYSSLWLVKIDSFGETRWNQSYSGPNNYISNALIKSSDGGYALVGASKVAEGDDFLLIKTDSNGVMQWSQSYNGQNVDNALTGIQTSDGGYALVGVINSTNPIYAKSMLVKTDATGTLQWSQTYGGNAQNVLGSMVQATDGGYAIAGYTNSTGAGSDDFWFVKTDGAGGVPTPEPTPTPTQSASPSVSPTSTGEDTSGSMSWAYVVVAVVAIVLVTVVVWFALSKRKTRPQTYYHPRRIES